VSIERSISEHVAGFFDPSVKAALDAIEAQMRDAPIPVSVCDFSFFAVILYADFIDNEGGISRWRLCGEPVSCLRVGEASREQKYLGALPRWPDVRSPKACNYASHAHLITALKRLRMGRSLSSSTIL
jgi:hypothetical protein